MSCNPSHHHSAPLDILVGQPAPPQTPPQAAPASTTATAAAATTATAQGSQSSLAHARCNPSQQLQQQLQQVQLRQQDGGGGGGGGRPQHHDHLHDHHRHHNHNHNHIHHHHHHHGSHQPAPAAPSYPSCPPPRTGNHVNANLNLNLSQNHRQSSSSSSHCTNPSSSTTAIPPPASASASTSTSTSASASSTSMPVPANMTSAPPQSASTHSPASPVLAPAHPSMASLADAPDLTSPSRIKVRNLSHIHSFASEEMLGAAATAAYASVDAALGGAGAAAGAAGPGRSSSVSSSAGAAGPGRRSSTFRPRATTTTTTTTTGRERAGSSGLFDVEVARHGAGSLPVSMGGRQYEISSMPVTDVIEMVAGILTKITTNNDAQHEPLHKYLTPHDPSREAPPPPQPPAPPASPSPPCMAGGGGGDPASQMQAPQTPPPLDPQSSSVLAFHGRNIPSISILSYLSRIHRYCPTTYEVFLSLLVYFDRMSAKVNGPLMQRILKREKEQGRAKRREERLNARNKVGRRSSTRQGQDPQQEQLHNYSDDARAQAAAHGGAVAHDPSQPPPMSSRYLSNPHLRPGPVHDPSSPFSTGTAEPDYEGHSTTTNREGGGREFSQSLTEDSSFAFPPMLSSSIDSVTESDSESSSSSDGDSWDEDNEFTETVFDGLDERIALSRTFVIDSYNVHRLVIAGVTCASKFFSDVFYTNSRYAKVGGLPLSELNHLELQFLFLNDFRLSVTIEELEAYGTMLVEFYASEVLAQQRAREQKQRESLMRAQAQFSKSPSLNNNNHNHFSSADHHHNHNHHQTGADMHYSPANANYRPAQQQQGAGYHGHGHGHGMGSAEDDRRASAGSASPDSEVCMRSAAADRERERERAAAAAAARHQQDHA